MKRILKIWAVLLLCGCAQQVAPTGGPKDETPPSILTELPANLSTNFTSSQIVISFDEFIQLKNTAEQVVISPPMLRPPTYQLKKKSLVVKFEQELADNTTYTINFGEAIKDNNEGNILANYTYVFSTGMHLDSMQVKGKVTNVITNEPVKDVLVMLYKNNIDSLPTDTIPDYFTRSNEAGQFHIMNVADQPYKIFALKDENTNYKFDVPQELIGFLDTLIVPFTIPKAVVPDSTQTDSIIPKLDSAPIPSYEMTMFVEEDTTQFLKKSYCDYFGKLIFAYNRPVSDLNVELQEVLFKSQWNLKDYNSVGDSITVWTTGAVPDTMGLILSADGAKTDTVELVMKPRADKIETKKQSKGVGKRKKLETFALTATSIPANKRSPKPEMPLSVVWNHPIIGTDLARVKLYEDSIRISFDIDSKDDALRSFQIGYDWKKGSKYQLLILDSAFNDIYGLWNDTVDISFVGTDEKSFGELSLNISEKPKTPIVIELLNSADRIIEGRVADAKGIVKFETLEPSKYSIRVIKDLNANGRWDSGRYSLKQQPEPIKTIEKDAEVRPNWELELEWNPNEE